jgi:iron complex outermembrane receptor protein
MVRKHFIILQPSRNGTAVKNRMPTAKCLSTGEANFIVSLNLAEGSMCMALGRCFARRAALCTSTSMLSIMLAAGAAYAQSTDVGSVDVQSSGAARNSLPPISSDAAIGSNAPAGSAPALAPAQGSLNAFEPGSTVSDKVIQDIIPPTSDYNEAVKYTPGYNSSNPNGLLGDAAGGWRGFQDGQYNITFDGIPFGDANNPSHHSAAYFPSAFLGSVIIDRGPGAASQVGYATFGGTMALRSIELSDTFGGNVQGSFGSYNTLGSSITMQTGLIGDSGVRGLFQYSHANTDGALHYGNVDQNQFLGKVEKKFDDFKVTVFSTYGLENYNNVAAITYPQLQAYGKHYGEVNGNPLTQQFVGYNNSHKQTDMEYVGVEGTVGNWHVENKLYTYSYWYPQIQNNGNNQTIEGNITAANGAVTSVTIPTIIGGKIKTTILGVASTDVVGYLKNNDYRAYGDIFKLGRDIDAGIASGTVRAGIWVERIDNSRLQEYIDYTTGMTFPQLGNSLQASYKLNLNSHITNVQPFVEYEWKPFEGLSITPGFKFESFTRDHDALVNQTTLQPMNYSHTYTANLPFLAARYKLTPDTTIYAQASQGMLAPSVSAYYVFDPSKGGIKPQTTVNYQAGAVYKTDKITADVDVYQVTASNFPVTNTLATGETIYANGGTAQYRGVEAEGSYSIINGLSVYASSAIMSAKYIAGQFTGMRVGDAPNYTAAGGFIYDDGMFFGSLLQKFTGDAYGSSGQKAATAGTNPSLNHIKPYNTTDLVIGIRSSALHDMGLGQNAQIKLGIYNIFNHQSTTEIAGDPTGVSNINNTTLTYSFLPGRLVVGSVSFTF